MDVNIDVRSRVLEILPRDPITGSELVIRDVGAEYPAIGESGVGELFTLPDPTKKMLPLREMAGFRSYENHGWRFYFDATHGDPFSRGLVVFQAYFHNVEYIYQAMIPWVGDGPFWHVVPSWPLSRLEIGPVVVDLQKGVIIYARYDIAYRTKVEELFYFDEAGNFVPLVFYSGRKPMGYIPFYVDFDINGPLRNSAVIYHPFIESDWHLAVPEFETTERTLGIPEPNGSGNRIANIILFNAESGLYWVEAYLNMHDKPEQYVDLWSTYNIQRHPRLNTNGESIVEKDIVYVYLVPNAPTGLHGPRFIVRQGFDADWKSAFHTSK